MSLPGTWSYSQLLTALQNNAQSAAPEVGRCRYAANRSNWRRKFDPARCGGTGLGATGRARDSASSPDAEIGFSDTALYGSSTDPNQTPSNNTYDLIGVAEHEISEGMGRVSVVNDDGSGGTTTNYSTDRSVPLPGRTTTAR